jgi:hypothetical protein
MLPTLGFRRSTDVGGLARLHQRMHAKRETKLAAERAAADRFRSAGVELFARASASALAFRDMFVAGRVLSPPGRVSMDERIGWQLAEFFGDYIPLEAVQARRARQGW